MLISVDVLGSFPMTRNQKGPNFYGFGLDDIRYDCQICCDVYMAPLLFDILSSGAYSFSRIMHDLFCTD
jgi:hypothetical protein